MLAWRHRGNIDPHKLTDIPRQCSCRAAPGFLGDGKQRVTVNQRLHATVDDCLERGQQRGNPGFVIQVTGADMTAFGELRQWVKRHKIADIDPQRIAVGTSGAVRIQP